MVTFRQLPILAVAKPLQLACRPIRHIVRTLHQGAWRRYFRSGHYDHANDAVDHPSLHALMI